MWAHDQDHTDRLRGHRIRILLRGIPDTLHDLEPAPRHGIGQRPTERQLPISERVLEAKRHLRATLASWALLVAEERHVTPTCGDTTQTIAAWLQEHTEWLGRHPAGNDAEEEIRAAVQQLEHLTDRPGPTIFAGNCPTCDTPAYAPEGHTTTHCRMITSPDTGETCGTEIDVHEARAALLTQTTTLTASAADIARILPVKAATVRQWGRRGKLGGYCDTTTRETRWHIGTVIDQLNRNQPIAA